MTSCLFGKKDISRHNAVFHRIRNSRKSKLSGILILIHTASVYQIDIFTVSQHRNIQFLCSDHCLFIQLCIHHRFAVFAQSRDTGFYHSFNIGKFFTFHPFRDRTNLQYIHLRTLSGFVIHISHAAGVVHHRLRIRHGYHRGNSSSGSGHGPCHDIFFMSEPRIAKMHMQINQSGHYITAFRINFIISRGINLFFHRGYLIVFN